MDGIGKVEIKGHQTPFLLTTNIKNPLIVSPGQLFAKDCFYIMTGKTKQRLSPIPEVFVKLELHIAASMGMSTYLSRDISAPKAIAAKTSSLES